MEKEIMELKNKKLFKNHHFITRNKKVLVYGLSISGEWVSRLLKKHKATVFLFDDDSVRLHSRRLKNCFVLQELNENIIKDLDLIVVSPAIEKDNRFLILAQQLGKPVVSELEFAASYAKNLVAVTGTNGKTTTVELIAAILSEKHKSIACGNNGYPVSKAILENKHHILVAEVSSFMLEHASTFAPHVATILNIEPDHLIRHKTMAEYTKLKYNIFANLKPTDYAVVNLDSNIHPTSRCNVVTYSLRHFADVYYQKGSIYLHQQKVVDINQLKIKGKHNILNAMCAVCYAYINKIPVAKIKHALINFNAASFRNTQLNVKSEINFVNDSKSTNIASTLASVEATQGAIILLLGGSKKGLNYNKLFEKLPKRVKQIVAFGQIADDLEKANKKFKFAKFQNLKQAFDFAVSVALPLDTVLFSPSSASYDQYSSYIERGNDFNNLVKQYVETKME